MSDELAILANDELRELNWLVDKLCIPDDILRDCLSAGFGMMVYKDGGAEYSKQLEKSNADFDRLCNAAPHVSRECLRLLSTAYTIIVLFIEDKAIEQSVRSGAMMLISAATAKGSAISLLPESVGYLSAKVQAERKALLSKAGLRGAESRNKPYEAVKTWALEKAIVMRGAHKDIARILANQLPPHLEGASKDPARLIYDALRMSTKLD